MASHSYGLRPRDSRNAGAADEDEDDIEDEDEDEDQDEEDGGGPNAHSYGVDGKKRPAALAPARSDFFVSLTEGGIHSDESNNPSEMEVEEMLAMSGGELRLLSMRG